MDISRTDVGFATVPDDSYPSYQKGLGFLLLVIFGGLCLRAVPSNAKIRIPGSNTILTISEGDILSFEGHKVIAANEFFDSEIGDLVSPTSLHGKCIQEFFNGDSRRFDSELEKGLPSEYETVKRSRGKDKKYGIGTVATVPCGKHSLFLTALSHTDVQTAKAKAEVEDLWIVLRQVWQTVRIRANGQAVAIPLF